MDLELYLGEAILPELYNGQLVYTFTLHAVKIDVETLQHLLREASNENGKITVSTK